MSHDSPANDGQKVRTDTVFTEQSVVPALSSNAV